MLCVMLSALIARPLLAVKPLNTKESASTLPLTTLPATVNVPLAFIAALSLEASVTVEPN